MKQQHYTDEQVANKLIEEGRMRYNAKSIGSRYLKMKKAIAAHDEERLDECLSDWHMGEVCIGFHQL